ncbi:hypothetical protein Tco_1521807 [Tanacetum coccineum]
MKWVLCVQWLRLAVQGLGLGFQSLHSYTIGLSRPIRWVKIASNSILQFWLRSVLTLTLTFLDFGLDFAQSFPFHAQFCHFGLVFCLFVDIHFLHNTNAKQTYIWQFLSVFGHLSSFLEVNDHEITLFTRTENFGHRPYANIKTEKTHDPYLDTNRIFSRNYEASNVDGTQRHDDDKDEPTPELPTCKIRRFEMMKYSVHDGKEYIFVKESEHLNHSKPSLDAYQELLRLIKEEWVVTSPDEQAE